MNRYLKRISAFILIIALILSLVGTFEIGKLAYGGVTPTGHYSIVVTNTNDNTVTATYSLTAFDTLDNGNTVYKYDNLTISAPKTIYVIDNDNSDERVPFSTTYIAATSGTYNITFTKNATGTAGYTTTERTTTDQKRYFVLGKFNDYTPDFGDDATDLTYYGANRMKFNATNLDYDEYVLSDVIVEDNDQDFYIGAYDASGTLVYRYPTSGKYYIDKSGQFNFYYAPSYDYGYGDKVRYERLRDLDAEGTIYIKNVEDFNAFAKKCNVDTYADKLTVVLQADLDFDGVAFSPIGVFGGTFLGNGHTIKNINFSGLGSYIGIFRYVKAGGVVDKLNVSAEITSSLGQSYLGGIAGSNKGLIKNCTFSGKIYGNTYIGGIVGVNEQVDDDTSTTDDNDDTYGYVLNGAIENCVNNGIVEGKGNAGGIAGLNRGTIYGSTNNGEINHRQYTSSVETTIVNIGGIVGYSVGNSASVMNSINNGIVGYKEVGNFIGGIVGMGLSKVFECGNVGEVYGDENVGGIIGFYANARSQESENYITDAYQSYLEQIFGDYEGGDQLLPESTTDTIAAELSYCYNQGKVRGNTVVGGILGYMSMSSNVTLSVHSSYNEGEIYAKNGVVGGIIGNQNSGAVRYCFNIGDISTKESTYIGGIAGRSSTTIDASFSICDLTGKSYLGGIVGSGYIVTDCYANVTITADGQNKGSIAGEITGRCETCYYVATDIGGIDGISYTYKAEGLSPLDMASVDMLPQKMVGFDGGDYIAGSSKLHFPQIKNFALCDSENVGTLFREKSDFATMLSYKIVFLGEDDETIKIVRTYYNEDVAMIDLPEVPKKDGYYAAWEKFDTSKITVDQKVHAIYTRAATAISSEDSAMPTIIIQGSFHPDTIVSLKENYIGDQSVLGKKVYKCYTVSATYDNKEEDLNGLVARVLVPDNMNKIAIVQITSDGYQKVASEKKGNYYEFTLDENAEFVITYSPKLIDGNTLIVIAVSVVIGAVLASGVAVIIHFAKKRKSVKNADTLADKKEDKTKEDIKNGKEEKSEIADEKKDK